MTRFHKKIKYEISDTNDIILNHYFLSKNKQYTIAVKTIIKNVPNSTKIKENNPSNKINRIPTSLYTISLFKMFDVTNPKQNNTDNTYKNSSNFLNKIENNSNILKLFMFLKQLLTFSFSFKLSIKFFCLQVGQFEIKFCEIS